MKKKPRITLLCQFCGKGYEILPSKKTLKSRFCSNLCSARATKRKHGDAQTRLYAVFKNMHNRCRNSAEYVAKGITVCAEWEDYLVFKSWAIANGYQDNLELDRIKNHIGYNPENCRFSTESQQARNQNKRKTGSSIYRGVSWHSGKNLWIAQSKVSGVQKWLGFFDSEVAAAEAYDEHVFAIDPEYCTLNFPERLRSTIPLLER